MTILHQPAQYDLITRQFGRLRRHFGGRIDPLLVGTRVLHRGNQRWDDLEKTGRLPDPVYRHLLETNMLKSGESPEAFIDLLIRSRDEWKQIVSEGRRLGYQWARLLDPARIPVGQGVGHAPA